MIILCSISVGDCVYSLCSINEKYILVGKANGELDVIDFNNKSIVKKYQAHKEYVYGIEKFKKNILRNLLLLMIEMKLNYLHKIKIDIK